MTGILVEIEFHRYWLPKYRLGDPSRYDEVYLLITVIDRLVFGFRRAREPDTGQTRRSALQKTTYSGVVGANLCVRPALT